MEIIKSLSDPVIIGYLSRSNVQDIDAERILTELRRSFLVYADEGRLADVIDDGDDALLYALAQYCFFSEYVFWITEEEEARLDRLETRLADGLRDGQAFDPATIAVVGCYKPLHKSKLFTALIHRDLDSFGEPARTLFRRQITEPDRERGLSGEIVRLSAIEDSVSRAVQSQYEENPYPRWRTLPAREATSFSNMMLTLYPNLKTEEIQWPAAPRYLVAGCGTGRLPISIAQSVSDTDIIAVDLSISSLAYGLRKTREMTLPNIRYLQGDILDIHNIETEIDVIDCSGVLHHMHDPMAGWQKLTEVLSPGGFMRIGLYSELARRYMVAAQQFARANGFDATEAGIRQCRQAIIALDDDDPVRRVIDYGDFYSLSDCRDMLFHVQEHRFDIPQIGRAIDRLGLTFVGFDFEDINTVRAYRSRFPEDPNATSLDFWHTYEQENPDIFTGMYNFWLRKPL